MKNISDETTPRPNRKPKRKPADLPSQSDAKEQAPSRSTYERKRTKTDLQISEKRFRLLVDSFPGMLVLYDAQRRFQMVNMRGQEMSGMSEEQHLGHTDEELYPRRLTEAYLPALRRAFKTKSPQATEAIFSGPSGQRTVAIRYIPILDEQGELFQVLGIGDDVTEQRCAELASKEQSARLEQQAHLLELAHDAIIIRDLEGRVLFWNHGAEEMYGWTADEARGQLAHSLLQTRSLLPLDDLIERLMAEGGWEGELTHTTQDGCEIIVASRWVLERDTEGGPRAILEINRDDTDRTRTRIALLESAERLRKLTHQVISLQEEERQRISRELHDDSAQALTAAKMSLESVEADLPLGFESLRRRVRESGLVIGETMDKIRALAQDLRPVALDRLGIHRALEGYCRDFSRRAALPVHYSGVETGDLPDTITISLYRLAQEALSNASKHAHARRVNVTLRKESKDLVLCIEDDGKGFDLKALSGSLGGRGGLGLVGMQERIQLVGGTLEVQSQPGRGTQLIARVPFTS